MKRARRPLTRDLFTPLPPRFLTSFEAARFLGISRSTLEKHRQFGTGPVYRKIGGRVLYRAADLERWADQGIRTSTVQPGASVAPAAKPYET
jgi:excisionase family DNA binding protein